MSAWTDDALFVGRRIVERLREQLPTALRDVSMLDELDTPDALPRQFPAAVVLLHRMTPGGQKPIAKRHPVEQQWMVMLAVRTARPEGDRIAEAVGQLIPATCAALQGWVPPGASTELCWVPGPRPDYSRETSLFPLVFEIKLFTG